MFRRFAKIGQPKNRFKSYGTDRVSTVEEAEIRSFERVKDNFWDESGVMRALHSLNKVRVPFVRDRLVGKELANGPRPLRNLRVLEVGCGVGVLSEPLARIGANMTGLDAAGELIEVAEQHRSRSSDLSNLTYVADTIEAHCETHSRAYDAVVVSEVVEHVTQKEHLLRACSACLRPGGSMFVTTMNRTLPAWLFGIVAAENVFAVAPKGIHEWDKFISPDDLADILDKCGCRSKTLHGFWYNVFTNNWQISTDVSINYGIHAIKD